MVGAWRARFGPLSSVSCSGASAYSFLLLPFYGICPTRAISHWIFFARFFRFWRHLFFGRRRGFFLFRRILSFPADLAVWWFLVLLLPAGRGASIEILGLSRHRLAPLGESATQEEDIQIGGDFSWWWTSEQRFFLWPGPLSPTSVLSRQVPSLLNHALVAPARPDAQVFSANRRPPFPTLGRLQLLPKSSMRWRLTNM
jgi:hypothetical protein